ncbi:B-cell receptor CD22 [Siphateles boraxobius]|uniref:B-cell receptor CD22 n=1 Tax=Siphateles boraxobius TaxID=180520 RepID=UPI00406457FE
MAFICTEEKKVVVNKVCLLFSASRACCFKRNITERPKPVLTVQPEPSQILRGETVTLTCDLQGEGWTYRWKCGDDPQHDSKEKEFKITVENRQKCRCFGCRGSLDADCSDWSDEVTLSVSVCTSADVIRRREVQTAVQSEHTCIVIKFIFSTTSFVWKILFIQNIQNNTTQRNNRYIWMLLYIITSVSSITERPKPVLTVQPEPSQILRGETVTLTCDLQREGWTYRWMCGDGREHTSKEKEFKITVEIRQKCRCFGCRGSLDADCSDWSDEVTLSVSDKPRVTVKPQSSVFTGDTVTLSCDVRRSTRRRILWYKNYQMLKSGDETETLRDVRVSDGGEYACAVQREKNSTTQGHRVMLTVRERPRAVLRVQPDGRVFRGETVTLTCDIQETDVTSWTYSWNKDDSEIHVNQSQEYRISSVSESHTGHYSCSGREMRGSRHTHTSDEVTLTLSGSRALVIGVAAGLSVLFLLIVLLVLLWRCKHNKGGGSPAPSTGHQQHNITIEEQKKNADTENGPSDVTYSEIDLKSLKEMEKKKKEGKTGECSDTVYSKLNIQTD